MFGDGRLLYERNLDIMELWGNIRVPWEELTEKQRAAWEEHAHDIAAQDREDINA